MIMKFDRELTGQAIYAHGNELASFMGMDRDAAGRRVRRYPAEEKQFVTTIQDPVLCTDYYRIGRLGDEDPVLRDTVMALYGTAQRVTIYDGTELWFVQDEYPGVWGPSIDTLFFCRGLATLDLSGIETVAEIGTGSGFITKWLLEHRAIASATMVDFHDLAIEAAREAIDDDRAHYHVGDGLQFLDGRRFDLVLCNPPYIPRPWSIDDNPYEGVGLLVELVERMSDFLTEEGRLVMNISSVADDVAMEAVQRVHAEVKRIDAMDVPLKVYNVLNNDEWRDFLVAEKGLEARTRDGYDFWHTIQLFEFRG